MAVRRLNQFSAYGVGDNLIPLAPLPIIARRDPTTSDLAQLGTMWDNELTGAVWILSSISANSANWATSAVSGNVVALSVDITTGGLTIDAGALGIDVGAGAFTVDNSGNTVVNNLTIGGTLTFTGTLNLVSAAEIIIESTFNGAPSILLEANGGAAEQIAISSLQGTSATSIDIASTSGGVALASGLNSATALSLTAGGGGGIALVAGAAGISVAATNGAVAITSGTGAINLGADAVAHTITMGNIIGATAVNVNSGTGGFHVVSTGAGDITLASS